MAAKLMSRLDDRRYNFALNNCRLSSPVGRRVT
jgi:hypothetical protein